MKSVFVNVMAACALSGCALDPAAYEAINNSMNVINDRYAPINAPADPYVPSKKYDSNSCVSGKRYSTGKDAGKCTDER